MGKYNLTYKPFGERSILVEWPSKIDKNILFDVLNFKDVLQKSLLKEKVYIKSAYNSILISYDITINKIYDKIFAFEQLYLGLSKVEKSAFKLWKIPVCYDVKFGIDLEEVSNKNNLLIGEIIRLHSAQIYQIYFIGFLPGFLYLGGLDKKLHFPRRATPRLQVKKGAIAIGGNQTGVYPNISPGGWNIIGNSPINFFDVTNSQPCFAQAGDSIQFYPVTRKEYDDIKTLVEAGVYQIESEVLHG